MQDQQSWVFYPQKVVVEVSTDGKTFEKVYEESVEIKPNMKKSIMLVSAKFPEREAQFVRVTAVNIKTCPKWHSCFGNPCWIFADEIVVE
ncbi:MAG: discoidin domain-containing protein [Lewinellaceae bacterium]|nr:discoidin domain-containing protein [Lewinellaceae bacterium]